MKAQSSWKPPRSFSVRIHAHLGLFEWGYGVGVSGAGADNTPWNGGVILTQIWVFCDESTGHLRRVDRPPATRRPTPCDKSHILRPGPCDGRRSCRPRFGLCLSHVVGCRTSQWARRSAHSSHVAGAHFDRRPGPYTGPVWVARRSSP